MCPISLAAIILLLLVIFYSISNLVTIVAAIILLLILFNFGKLEKFTGLTIDPEDTGMVHSNWGPLYPVESKVTKEQSYYTMKGLPWCSPPLHPTEEGASICHSRTGAPR